MRQFGRLLGIYSLLGVVVGVFAIGFDAMVRAAADLLTAPAAATTPGIGLPSGYGWLLLLLPAAGGLVSGLVCAFWAPEASGPGTGHVIDAYLRRRGEMRRRVPFAKTLAAAVTLGSGGSAGVEGPIGQVAAGIGGWFGRVFRLTAAERRVLVMAGLAAGIGAVFHAPMAAAIFAAEVLYSDMDIEHEVLVPAIIAATVAHGVFGGVRGWAPLLTVPYVDFPNALQLLPYLALACLLALGATLFIRLHEALRAALGRAPRVPLWARPALGGLGVGLVGAFVPQALGAGYGIVEIALAGTAGIGLLFFLAAAKMLTTALTAGSGGSGGLFGPSLVIGGALGGAVGVATMTLFPGLGVQPAAFVVVGMAGFFAAAANAPLSTVIMVAEVVGSYRLIVPALWVCTLAWVLSRRVRLFPDQVPSRLDAPFRLADMMGAVLHRIPVTDAMSERAWTTVPPSLPLRDLVELFAHSTQGVFPITEPGTGRLLGVVDGRQLRHTLAESGVDTLLIANDFQVPALEVDEGETLFEAISRMTASGFDEVVVTRTGDAEQVAGILSRREVVNAYHRRMLERAPDTTESIDATDEMPDDADLAAAIERGGVLHDVEASSPDEALTEMLRRAELPAESDRPRLLELLRAREALGSTGVGDGIALPHPHAEDLGAIDRPRVVVGLLERPLDWDAYDGEPVWVVCMLLCPSGDTHLALLGALARALHDPALLRLLEQHAPERAILTRLRELSQ